MIYSINENDLKQRPLINRINKNSNHIVCLHGAVTNAPGNDTLKRKWRNMVYRRCHEDLVKVFGIGPVSK